MKRMNAKDEYDSSNYPVKVSGKVDPVTGKPSNAPNSISESMFRGRQTVDPVTGKPSDAPDAIYKYIYNQRQKVDPVSGKPSDAQNAISRSKFKARIKVDPNTGKPSDALNAISQSAYNFRKTVDPITGKLSDALDAISRSAFYSRRSSRRKVDPNTGKPSDKADAISKYMYGKIQKVLKSGKASDFSNAVAKGTFCDRDDQQGMGETSCDYWRSKKRKRGKETVTSEQFQIDISNQECLPVSSHQMGNYKGNLKPVKQEKGSQSSRLLLEFDVSDDHLIKTINAVNSHAIIFKDKDSDNCEIQAARLVSAIQGKDISKVSMKDRGIQYSFPEGSGAWGFLIDGDLVEDDYHSLIGMTKFLTVENDSIVSDMTQESCVTNVINVDEIDAFFERLGNEKEERLLNQGGYVWGLMGLELGGVWHQVVWIEREDDYVICDPNGVNWAQDKLLNHHQLKLLYLDLSRVSILKFSKEYIPLRYPIMKKPGQDLKEDKQEDVKGRLSYELPKC